MLWASIIVAILLYLVYLNLNLRNLPPAPFILPFIGNLYNFGLFPHEALFKLHKKYGHVIRLHMGYIRTIVISDGNLIREAFLSKGRIFSGRFLTPTFSLAASDGKNISGRDAGSDLTLIRKVVANMFSNTKAKDLVSVFEHSIDQLCTILDMFATSQEPFDIGPLLAQTTLSSILKILYNKDISVNKQDHQDQEVKELIDIVRINVEIASAFQPSDFIPILRFFSLGSKRITSFKECRSKFLGNIVKDHSNSLNEANPRDWLDLLLIEVNKLQEEKKKIFSIEVCGAISWDMILAGTETVSTTLNWLCLIMAKYQDVQQKVFLELNTVLNGRKPGLDDKVNLPYTNAVIKESMRIRPILPFLVPHRNTEDSTLGGFFIPANSQILANSYAYHLDEKYFPNPKEFRPERFLDSNNPASEVLPFSIGWRVCPGKEPAQVNIFLMFTALIYTYTLKPAPGQVLDLWNAVCSIELNPVPYQIQLSKR